LNTGSAVLQLDRQENIDHFAEREALFSIGGKEYTIPKHVPASVTIRVTTLAIEKGEGEALEYAMECMLGVEGYEALQACETLTREDFQAVVKAVTDRVIPSSEGGAPKAS
jgi:hypothetical protein